MDRTCSIDGCRQPRTARGWCSPHYQAWYSHGTPTPVPVECVDCGVDLGRPQGRKERCSTCAYERVKMSARNRSARLTAEGANRKAPRSWTCSRCGQDAGLSVREKTLCKACSRDSSVSVCAETGCGRPVRARDLCSMHYKRVRRAEGVDWKRAPWGDARRDSYHRRRALKAGATIGEPFRNLDIFQRDRWTCQLCDHKIDPEVKWPNPRSASLDHVVPLSLGGAHSRSNTQLACLECNTRKGNRAQSEQLALLG